MGGHEGPAKPLDGEKAWRETRFIGQPNQTSLRWLAPCDVRRLDSTGESHCITHDLQSKDGKTCPIPTSDLNEITLILERAGITYSAIEDVQALQTGVMLGVSFYGVRVREGKGKRNLGYPEFFTDMFFDKNGTLIAMGAWE